jgi:membrane fusion protein, macrolide-specific efflux system
MNKKLFNSSIIAMIAIGAIVGSYVVNRLSKRPSFGTVAVTRENITEGINVYGKVISENVVDLGFENGGKITILTHKVGDTVKKGEILARVDASDVLAQLRQAKALENSARYDVDQYDALLDKEEYKLKSLKSSGASSSDKKAQKEQIDASDAQKDSYGSKLEAAKASAQYFAEKLNETILRSPIDGIISKQETEIGEIASQGGAIITVFNNNDYKTESFVSQIDISKISLGNVADVTLDSIGTGTVYKAKVVAIDPAETDMNGISNYKITLKLDNFDEKIKSGSDANIKIYNKSKNDALVISRSALISENNKDYVLVYANGKEEKKEVKTGLSGVNGKVEIVSGLSEGDNILSVQGK